MINSLSFLIIGCLVVFSSFLFFGWKAEVYMTMLALGIMIALIAYSFLLFRKETRRRKLLGTFVVIIAVVVQYVLEPYLIKGSFLMYVHSNASELHAINELLRNKEGDLRIHQEKIVSNDAKLNEDEIKQLKMLQKEVEAYMILKSDAEIHYGLFGFLNTRIGVSYVLDGGMPKMQFVHSHLKGNWYY